MSKRKLVLLVLVIMVSGAALWWVIRTQGSNNKKFAPYIIMLRATDYYDDGRIVEVYKEVRFVDSRGNWRSLLTYANGQTIETVGEEGRGTFTIDPKDRSKQFKNQHTGHVDNLQNLKKSKQYQRTALILGNATYLMKVRGPDGSDLYFYHAVDLNGDIIMSSYRGDGFRRVVEPVSVWRGEPRSDFVRASVP